MYDIFDENAFESKNDENLNRKFDYNYQAIKHFYPEVSKLPEQEVAGIVQTMYEKDDDSFDDTKRRAMDYIKSKEPSWQKYFSNNHQNRFKDKSTDEWLDWYTNQTDPTAQKQIKMFKDVRPSNISISPSDKMLATNYPARLTGFVMQGMAKGADNLLNNISHGRVDLDVDTLEPNNNLEKGGEFLYNNIYGKLFKRK